MQRANFGLAWLCCAAVAGLSGCQTTGKTRQIKVEPDEAVQTSAKDAAPLTRLSSVRLLHQDKARSGADDLDSDEPGMIGNEASSASNFAAKSASGETVPPPKTTADRGKSASESAERATLGDLSEPSDEELDGLAEAFDNADPQVRRLFEQQLAAARNLRATRSNTPGNDASATQTDTSPPVIGTVATANGSSRTTPREESTPSVNPASVAQQTATPATPGSGEVNEVGHTVASARLSPPVPPASPRTTVTAAAASTHYSVPSIAAAHRSVAPGSGDGLPTNSTSPNAAGSQNLADSVKVSTPPADAASTVAAAARSSSPADAAPESTPRDAAALLAELAARADELAANSNDPTGLRPVIQQRLALMLAGQFEQATAPVEGLQPAEQQYLQQQLSALRVLLDPNGSPVRERRWSDALGQLRPAVNQLAAATGRLDVRSVQFCTAVESFGRVTAFPKYEFQPGQQVILYCEVDSFTALQTKDGFETELRGEYSICNDKDVRVADQELPTDQQTCANYRRDYFIAYRLYLPKRLEPGTYRLQLTIEDGKSERYGQTTIPFTIVAKNPAAG